MKKRFVYCIMYSPDNRSWRLDSIYSDYEYACKEVDIRRNLINQTAYFIVISKEVMQ